MVDPNVLRQEHLEGVSVEYGIRKYRNDLLTTPLSEVGGGLALLKHCMQPMVNAINVYFKPSRGDAQYHRIKETLKQIPPETLAFLTIKHVVNCLGQNPEQGISLQKICIGLATMIRDNHEYMTFKAEHPGYAYRVEEGLHRSTTTPQYKRKVYKRARAVVGSRAPGWDEVSKLHIGRVLVDMLIEATGIVEVETYVVNGKNSYTLVPTDRTLAYLEKAHAKCELLQPQYMPMVIPPRDWSTPFDGGFLSTLATMRHKIIKTRNSNELFNLAGYGMHDVYSALNTLQRTRWRINRRVFEVMKELWAIGKGAAGLPSRDEEPLPARPWEPFGIKPDEAEKKRWKMQAVMVYERRIRVRSKRVAAAIKLNIARELVNDPEIYFCYNMDWRGRVYPIQNFINPQADDSGRALIEFAKPVALGEHGAKWLAVHGANCFGIDKVTFDERVSWVDEHKDLIQQSADFPLDCHWWEEADDPFQFLAFCFEWRDLLAFDGDKSTFKSHLPVGMDGSCNGLQNFSGMLLDPVGAAATNLLPSDSPEDIYQKVASVLDAKVRADAAAGVVEAVPWVGKINRKITKRGVMTTPYGAKMYGIRNQLREEMNKLDPNYLGIDGEDPKAINPPIRYLAVKLYEAIGEVVVAARNAMEWLQRVARVCSKAGTPIRWTTPVGFRPLQDYRESQLTRVETIWGGLRVRLGLRVDSEKLDKKRQANGISPNYVHSLDASHMMMTVNKCSELGLQDFSMVHDSYGVHAGHVDTLNKVLREMFIQIYSEDQLAKFHSEVITQIPAELADSIPPPPKRGAFDITKVRDSKYFFG